MGWKASFPNTCEHLSQRVKSYGKFSTAQDIARYTRYSTDTARNGTLDPMH